MKDESSTRSDEAINWALARRDFYEAAASPEVLEREAPIEYWVALTLLRSARDKRGKPACEGNCRREQCHVKGSCAFQRSAAVSERGLPSPEVQVSAPNSHPAKDARSFMEAHVRYYIDGDSVIATETLRALLERFFELLSGPSERPCDTCKGDPAICATVPGLRHCEAANRAESSREADPVVGLAEHWKDADHPAPTDVTAALAQGVLRLVQRSPSEAGADGMKLVPQSAVSLAWSLIKERRDALFVSVRLLEEYEKALKTLSRAGFDDHLPTLMELRGILKDDPSAATSEGAGK